MFDRLIVKCICPKLKVKTDKTELTGYDPENDALIFGYNYDEDDLGFRRHIYTHHHFPLVNKYSLRLWTILHEIGHHHTIDYAEDDFATRAVCALVSAVDAREDEDIQNMYFNIESEWEATEWAICWIENHLKLARVFDTILNLGGR